MTTINNNNPTLPTSNRLTNIAETLRYTDTVASQLAIPLDLRQNFQPGDNKLTKEELKQLRVAFDSNPGALPVPQTAGEAARLQAVRQTVFALTVPGGNLSAEGKRLANGAYQRNSNAINYNPASANGITSVASLDHGNHGANLNSAISTGLGSLRSNMNPGFLATYFREGSLTADGGLINPQTRADMQQAAVINGLHIPALPDANGRPATPEQIQQATGLSPDQAPAARETAVASAQARPTMHNPLLDMRNDTRTTLSLPNGESATVRRLSQTSTYGGTYEVEGPRGQKFNMTIDRDGSVQMEPDGLARLEGRGLPPLARAFGGYLTAQNNGVGYTGRTQDVVGTRGLAWIPDSSPANLHAGQYAFLPNAELGGSVAENRRPPSE